MGPATALMAQANVRRAYFMFLYGPAHNLAAVHLIQRGDGHLVPVAQSPASAPSGG